MKILIIEEDLNILGNIIAYLNEYSKVMQVEFSMQYYTECLETYSLIFQYDLLIIDMENKNNDSMIELYNIRKINRNIDIIMVTKSLDYLKEGYKVHTDGYLLKPIKRGELDMILDNIIDEKTLQNDFIVDYNICTKKIYFSDITHIEIMQRKSLIYFVDGSHIETNYSLKFWLHRLLCHPFIQTHKSFIVNMDNALEFKNNLIILMNQIEIPLSRHFKAIFEASYFNYITRKT